MKILSIGLIDYKDFIITPLIIVILFIFSLFFTRNENKQNKKIFKLALFYRIILSIIHSILANTIIPLDAYYDAGGKIRNSFYSNPIDFFKILFSNAGDSNSIIMKYKLNESYTFFSPQNFLTSKFGGFFEVLTMGSYVSAVIFFSLFSLLGLWSLYKTFVKLFPNLYKEFSIACLFLPSVSFFGSCYLKDPLTLGLTGFLTSILFSIFIFKRRIVLNIAFLLITSYLLFAIKPYIIVCFIPMFFVFIFFLFKNKIQNRALRLISTPLVVITLLFLLYFSYSSLSSTTERFASEQLLQEAVTTQDYIKRGSEGKASGYDIGPIQPTFGSVLSKIPVSIQFSLFRPFVWEAEKGIQYIAALDSLAILLFTLYVLFKRKFKFFIAVFKSPIIQLCLFFALSFLGIIGFVSANYGTLIRYKIPGIPFYVIALILILNFQIDDQKKMQHT
jgi:hypothetical protein